MAQSETLSQLNSLPSPSQDPPLAIAAVDLLLRDRRRLLGHLLAGDDQVATARVFVLTITAGCAAFGASLGLYRGGAQVLYAALKLPLVVLLTAAICTPALVALRRVVTGRSAPRRDLILVLASLALGSLLLAALAPLLLLASSWEVAYHDLVLWAVACCSVAGLAGLLLLWRGLGDLSLGRRLVVGTVSLALVTLVGAQLTWTLRPWLVRPRSIEVPFVRQLEGSFADAVLTSVDSAQGVYHRSEAPLPCALDEELSCE